MSNIPRINSCFIVIDYLKSLGYTIHEEIPLNITDPPILYIDFFGFFLNADLLRVVTGNWKVELIEKNLIAL